MSAIQAGRAPLIITTLILVVFAMLAVRAMSDPATAGDKLSPRPQLGEPPAAPSSISHRQRQVNTRSPSMPPPPKPKDDFVYLPVATLPLGCDLNAEEEAIAVLATGHPDQEREGMRCHEVLAQVARDHAIDMATRDYFHSVNPDGFGPNYRVEQAGYELPDWYAQKKDANNIESIAAVHLTPGAAWNSWLDSPDHRKHVLGDSDFFEGQTNYGIGYAFSATSTYKHYWVFISAHPEE